MDPHRRHLGFKRDHTVRAVEKTKRLERNLDSANPMAQSEQKCSSKAVTFSAVPRDTLATSRSAFLRPAVLEELSGAGRGPALAYFFVTATFIRFICPRQSSELGTQSFTFTTGTIVLATV